MIFLPSIRSTISSVLVVSDDKISDCRVDSPEKDDIAIDQRQNAFHNSCDKVEQEFNKSLMDVMDVSSCSKSLHTTNKKQRKKKKQSAKKEAGEKQLQTNFTKSAKEKKSGKRQVSMSNNWRCQMFFRV